MVAYLYTIAAICAGVVLSSFAFNFKVAAKIGAVWVYFFTVAFFTNFLGLVAATVLFSFFVKQQAAEVKLFYFVALMPVLPLQTFFIPFPGLNYLWEVNFIRLLILALFLPMLFEYLSRPAGQKKIFQPSDIYFFIFIFFTSILAIREGNITGTVREVFSIIVDYGIPYFVISRFLLRSEGMSWLLCGFLISAVFISLFSLIETFKAWRFIAVVFHTLNLDYDPIALIPYTRRGFVRAAGGTMFQSLSFAYFASLAMVVAFFFLQRKIIRFFPFVVLSCVLLPALYYTGSKGGMLAMLIGIGVILYFRIHISVRFLANIASVIVIPVVLVYFVSTGFSTVDGEGSFSYRYQLILNSLHAISNNPILGSINFIDDPMLQASMQGEGIIDVVNSYLQIVLKYGLVGLFLYLMIFVSLIKATLKSKQVIGVDYRDLMLALLFMTMFFIFTCSTVSFIPWYILLLWALTRAYIDFQVQAVTVNEMTSSQAIVK